MEKREKPFAGLQKATLSKATLCKAALRVAGTDSAWLLGLAAVAGFVLVFGWLAEEMQEGDTLAFDRHVLLAFRHPDDVARLIGPVWLPEVMRDLTALGSTVVLTLVLLLVSAYLFLTRKRAMLVLMLVSVIGGQLITTALKLLFDRPRPDVVPGATDLLNASFPSGHTMLSTVTYLTLGALLARISDERGLRIFFRVAALTLTLLVGVSRVALGVHWPTDVLAGWCVGAAWATLCASVARRLSDQGDVERIGPSHDGAAAERR